LSANGAPASGASESQRQVLARGAASARAPALRIAGIGRICMWQGGSLWIGRNGGHAATHAHHAIQLTFALDGPQARFRLRGGASPSWTERGNAAVMPNRPHEFDGCGGAIAHIFIEPETPQGHRLAQLFGARDISPLPAPLVAPAQEALGARYRRRASDDALVAASREIVAVLTGPLPHQSAVSPRVAVALDVIAARFTSSVSLREVAAAVNLSPSRLRHLFVQETGTTYRAYVLWLRINHAVRAMVRGSSWTIAAHEAGFADSAHLSRTFRRMFGVSPAMLIRE
jgi:AraC-like DNA-binding protein